MMNLLFRFKLLLRRLVLRHKYYKIGRFEIELTNDHSLPEYQYRFPTYDRFLPSLCKHLPSGSVVVDVGANVGDTIAAIGSENIGLRFLAIEPDPEYSALLFRNVERMRCTAPELDVEIVKAFVGDNLSIVGSKGGKGTRRALISQDNECGSLTTTLDEMLQDRGIDESCLVKVDTDGFDWSVINSGRRIISNCKPMLFFECDLIENGEYLKNYQQSIALLEKCGYNKFYVFDNFGGMMGEFSSARDVSEILKYVKMQNKKVISRTIYYIDILATNDRNDIYARKCFE